MSFPMILPLHDFASLPALIPTRWEGRKRTGSPRAGGGMGHQSKSFCNGIPAKCNAVAEARMKEE